MAPYGKVAQAAISSTSLLAQYYGTDGGQRLNSREIAERRKLSQTIVAKVLSTLSQSGLVVGSPGPGGGYMLARAPEQITLQQVIAPFERLDMTLVCPYGEGWCGTGPQCPLHLQLVELRSKISDYLQQTTLSVFSTPSPIVAREIPAKH